MYVCVSSLIKAWAQLGFRPTLKFRPKPGSKLKQTQLRLGFYLGMDWPDPSCKPSRASNLYGKLHQYYDNLTSISKTPPCRAEAEFEIWKTCHGTTGCRRRRSMKWVRVGLKSIVCTRLKPVWLTGPNSKLNPDLEERIRTLSMDYSFH